MNDFLTLKLKPQELDTLAQALMQMPWGQVNALMVNIQNQVTAQQKIAAEPLTGDMQMASSPNGQDAAPATQ